MKNKKWLLIAIIAFPSMFWLILESSTINSRRLPYYGPKKPLEKGDTAFHRIYDLNPDMPPVYAIAFLAEEYRPDAYRLTGIWEYLKYKEHKIRNLPLVLVREADSSGIPLAGELNALGRHRNVTLISLQKNVFKKSQAELFSDKPYYVDLSFFALIDANRNVRGFYDARYVAEIKRLIDEHQHLLLKEEKQRLIKTNEIEQRD